MASPWRTLLSVDRSDRAYQWVLTGLALALTALNPSFMSPLYNTSAGHKLVFSGLVMMAIGSLILKKIVSFKG